MIKDIRIDFRTTKERKEFLKQESEKQEITISQYLNKIIKLKMDQVKKYASETRENDSKKQTEEIIDREELLRQLDEYEE